MHINLRFLFLASGIFVSFCVFGVLQEKIFKSTYGENDKFTYVMSLLFIQTTANFIYAFILNAREPSQAIDKTPVLYYCCIALTFLLAMASSFEALRWVSYPAQVIAKSGKPIPVLIMGVLIGNKTFPLRKYFFVLLIVFGVTVFVYKDGKGSISTTSIGLGEMLLVCSLAMDGLTNAVQERVMFNYSPTSHQMMLTISKFSAIFLGLIIVFSGEVWKFVTFIQEHPSVLWDISLLSFTSSIGQFFIYKTIFEFGTLTCSLITTTRKFFSVLGSIIIFGNALIPRQWFALVCVFSGLFLDSYYGKSSSKRLK